MRVDQLKSRIRLKQSGSKKDDRAKPAAPSLDFALPEPLAPKPRLDEATDGAPEEFHVDVALAKADPQKVADRVYELMQREMADARIRGGKRRK